MVVVRNTNIVAEKLDFSGFSIGGHVHKCLFVHLLSTKYLCPPFFAWLGGHIYLATASELLFKSLKLTIVAAESRLPNCSNLSTASFLIESVTWT